MFYGMSSVKECWKRARSTAHSDLETTSSDYSFDDSNSSISREYRDASCDVDFDGENDIIDENSPGPTNELIENVVGLTTSKPDNVQHEKPSRYIRWRVLMCLGIGLWAVLCIVDLLHSEKSFTRDWLYEFIWGQKIVPKVELPKELEAPAFWYSDLAHYVWKIMSIMTSGGAYVLLFLLMVVFCADPRLKNPSPQISTKNHESSKASPCVVNDLIVEKKSLGIESTVRHPDELRIPKIISVRLELSPAINLQRKFISIEKSVQADLTKNDNSAIIEWKIRQDESSTCFSINRQLVELLSARNNEKLNFSSIDKIDWTSMRKIEAVLKDSASVCVMEARKSDLNLNASTFDLEIGEYLKKTSRPLHKISSGNSRRRTHESKRKFLNFEASSLSCDKTMKTRIITSSPAFKKFLFNFQQNNTVL